MGCHKMTSSFLTSEVLAYIGRESDPEVNRFPISEEMVYELADSIEDPNPIYRDYDYAKGSRFKSILCPPLASWKDFGPSIDYFGAGQERHVQVPLPFKSYGLNASRQWTFFRPVCVGDRLTRLFRIADIFERGGRTGQLVFIVRDEQQTNQRGELVQSVKRTNVFRKRAETEAIESKPISGQFAFPPISPPGANEILVKPKWDPKPQVFFDEIFLGGELPPITKGPITTTHLVRWAAANGNYARIHWDLPFAVQRQGLPNVVVNGTLKNQYLGQLLQTFAGCEGWLLKLHVEHRGMDYPGDTLSIFGKIAAITEHEEYGLVRCDVGIKNDRGTQTTTGWAEVILPKRGHKLPLSWPDEE